MVRGDPIFRKEDCSQYDVGLVLKEIGSYSDQDKLKFIENVWKPGELFDFPISVECSNTNRHFVWSWLKRFPCWHTLNMSMVHFVYRVFVLESSVGEIGIN